MSYEGYAVIVNRELYNAVETDSIFFEGSYQECQKAVDNLRTDQSYWGIRIYPAIYDEDFLNQEDEAA